MAEFTPPEPTITINGNKLTEAQAMTVRVALEAYALGLTDLDSLGSDEVGRGIRAGYQRCIGEIRKYMQ